MSKSKLLIYFLTAVSILSYHAPSAEAQSVTHLMRVPGRVLDVMHIDINGDKRQDLIVAHLAEAEKRSKSGRKARFISTFLQQKDGTKWQRKPSSTIELADDIVLFSVADMIGSRGADLVLISRDRIDLLEFKDNAFKKSQTHKSPAPGFFDFSADGAVFRWELCKPLIAGSRASLLFPTKAGYYVLSVAKGKLVQRGIVTVPSRERFGPPLETQFLNRFLTYFSRLPRVIAIDVNNDKRLDLLTYRSKGLACFYQKADGTFASAPSFTKTLDVVKKAETEGSDKKPDGAFASVQLTLRDLNNDGTLDIVATKRIGKVGVFESLRSQVLVFLSKRGQILQDKSPNRIINLKGISLFPEFTDFNGDNDVDLVLSSLRVDLMTNLKRAITRSVSTTYRVFLYRGGPKVYSDEADIERSVDFDLDLLEKQGQVRLTFFGADFTGDGLKEMIQVNSKKQLTVTPAGIESSFFSGDSLALLDDKKIQVSVPTTPFIEITDIDGDKRDELLLIYKRINDPENRNIRIIEMK